MRERKQQPKHSVDFLFTLLTFLIYAGAMILLVGMGTLVYRNVTQRMEEHTVTRTVQAYITEKIRQNDGAGRVSVKEMDGKTVLVLEQTIENTEYVTCIYEDEGWLKELFTKKDGEYSLSGGTEMLEVREFSAKETDLGSFRFQFADETGIQREFMVYLDSREQEE